MSDARGVGRVVLHAAVSAAFLGVLMWRADAGAVAGALRGAGWHWVAVAVPLLALAKALHGVRWWLLIRRTGDVPLWEGMLMLLAATGVGVILPLRAGAVLQVQVLHRRYRVERATIAGMLVLEGFLDTVSLLMLAAAAVPILSLDGLLSPRAVLGAVAVLAVVTALVALMVHRRSWPWLLPRAPAGLRRSIEREAGNLARGFATVGSLRVAMLLVLITLANWLVSAAALWVAGQGFALAVPIDGYLAAEIVGTLSGAVPLTQENIGPYELAVRETLVRFGAQGSPAAFAIAAHAAIIATAGFVGLAAAWALRLGWDDLFYLRADAPRAGRCRPGTGRYTGPRGR